MAAPAQLRIVRGHQAVAAGQATRETGCGVSISSLDFCVGLEAAVRAAFAERRLGGT